MSLVRNRLPSYIELSETEAGRISNPRFSGYTVEVHPPRNDSVPSTLESVVEKLLELQTKWLKFRNVSPVLSFEILRFSSSRVQLQFTVPTKRMERNLRTGLKTAVPGVGFDEGEIAVPVFEEESVGGGLLTLGRMDCYPLNTEYQSPPNNDVVSTLHRHAMKRSRFVVQVLLKPVAGKPFRNWWWRKRTYQRRNYLRKNKEGLFTSRNPTPREKKQAGKVEEKAGSARFQTSIRFLVFGAGEHTPSRVKELAAGYNRFESGLTGQYLDTFTVRSLRRKAFKRFARSVVDRRFGGWSRSFQASVSEVAGLVSIPSVEQKNIRYSKP